MNVTSSQLYNLAVWLKNGTKSIDEFKRALVTTIKTPLTSAEFDAGKKQQIITQVTIYIRDGKATFFGTRGDTQYTAERMNNKTVITGTPPLSGAQQEAAFNQLFKETMNASPFDSLENGKNIHNAVRELAPDLKLKKK